MNMHAPLAAPDNPSAATPEGFRSAMRHLAGGVSIVTSGRGAQRGGLTATSVSSLSMEPPSLIVCINRNSSMISVLRDSGSFAVNILGAHHREIADRFAGRHGIAGADRFSGADWIELVTGAPLLSDALAGVDCVVDNIIDWHTHALVIGRVEAVRLVGGPRALAYWRGNYADICHDQDEPC